MSDEQVVKQRWPDAYCEMRETSHGTFFSIRSAQTSISSPQITEIIAWADAASKLKLMSDEGKVVVRSFTTREWVEAFQAQLAALKAELSKEKELRVAAEQKNVFFNQEMEEYKRYDRSLHETRRLEFVSTRARAERAEARVSALEAEIKELKAYADSVDGTK